MPNNISIMEALRRVSKTAQEYTLKNTPHVISDDVIITIPAASIVKADYEEAIATGESYYVPITGEVPDINSDDEYRIRYNNVEYKAHIYNDTSLIVAVDEPNCSIDFVLSRGGGQSQVNEIADSGIQGRSASVEPPYCVIDELNVDNITDIEVKCIKIQKLNNKFLESDLKIKNSISMNRTGVIGELSTALGEYTTASGNYSHAEGYNTTASDEGSHAEGMFTTASGMSSHVEGSYTKSSGNCSHAEGYDTTASGDFSHAEGYDTTASGINSHAEGNYTKASSRDQHVQGRYNIEDTANKYAHIVGNGAKDATTNWQEVRSNAHTLDWEGNAWYAGDVQANNVPHVVSEKVVLTVPAATITAKKTEIDNATKDNFVAFTVEGATAVVYDSTKSYYMKYNNKEYYAAYNHNNFLIVGDDCLCGIMIHDGDPTMLRIGALDTTNITDMQLIEKDIKKLDTMYAPDDLTVNNSITVGGRKGGIGKFSSSFGLICEASGQFSHAEGENTIASGETSHAEGYATTASGETSHTEGYATTASARYSHAEGYETTASGDYSHAEGYSTTASGEISHAEGYHTAASGNNSHAEGENTNASGNNSHAEGWFTVAASNYQHVQGKYNIEDANYKYAHIVGNGISALSKSNAHTLDWEGNAWYAGDVQANNLPYVVSENVVLTVPAATITEKKTEIDNATQENFVEINVNGTVTYDPTKTYHFKYNNNEYSLAYSGGMFTVMTDDCFCGLRLGDKGVDSVLMIATLDTTNITDIQIIEKDIKKLDNKFLESDLKINNSITVGARRGEIGLFSSSCGINCEASGDSSHAEGNGSKALNLFSHAEGNFTTASGDSSHAEGYKTTASAGHSHAEGENTTASGNYSHAEGFYTTASGESSHAEGGNTTASRRCAHAEGYETTASGDYSHAECYMTTASGNYSHAEGYETTASGDYSHTEGYKTTASAGRSHAEGYMTTASGNYSHAEGYVTIASGLYQHVYGRYNIEDTANKYVHIVGNGDSGNKSNAHTLDWEGNAWYGGKVSQDAEPVNDNDLTTKKYVDEHSADVADGFVMNDQVSGYKYLIQMKGGVLTSTLLPSSISVDASSLEGVTFMEGDAIDVETLTFMANYPDGSSSSQITDTENLSYTPSDLTTDVTQISFVYTIAGLKLTYDMPITVTAFDPAVKLQDFEYTANDDGTYTLTGWKETHNGVASTELIIPNNKKIIL